MKELINKLLSIFSLELRNISSFKSLRDEIDESRKQISVLDDDNRFISSAIKLMSTLLDEKHSVISQYWRMTKSQIAQELFVISQLNYKRGGYFVEFGATDGERLSNTLMLEKHFGWKGILAEPCISWQEALMRNRTAYIERRCVWSKSGEKIIFNEVNEAEFSTIVHGNNIDFHSEKRKSGMTYEIETVSLDDLLTIAKAPSRIDYLSIDTEGSEFEILNSVDFKKWKFSVITCEHNYTPQRDAIFELLTQNGYTRKLEHISDFDDWYINNDLI